MAVTGPDFISLQARDLELSTAFYEQYLGLVRSQAGPVTFLVAPNGVAGHRPRYDFLPLSLMIWGVLSPRFGGCQ
jgi:hypothetical protein